jgi:hypothetical protein
MHEIQERRKCNEKENPSALNRYETSACGLAQSLKVRLEIFQFGQTLSVHYNKFTAKPIKESSLIHAGEKLHTKTSFFIVCKTKPARISQDSC